MAKILKWNNVRKTINYLKKNGVVSAYYAAKERVATEKAETYFYKEPSASELTRQREETRDFTCCISIVVPAYETKEEFLLELLASVERQSYEKWELIIVDASTSSVVKDTIEHYQHDKTDNRIHYLALEENKGISENTNAGIRVATGDYIALLDHDDFLTPDALYYMVSKIRKSEQEGIVPELVYSDEDKFENNTGFYIDPHRKTEFNLDLILSNNYICHFTAVKASTMKALLLRKEYDGAQDFDLVLRVTDRLLKNCENDKDTITHDILKMQIVHVPKILYHWRCHPESTAANTASKMYAYEAGKRAVEDFCGKQGWKVQVNHSLHLGFYHITYEEGIFQTRKDVGIVGGSLLNGKNRICGGMYDEQGKCVYEGLHSRFSGGNTHRAVLTQDCTSVDIRCMQLREELWPIYEQITGIAYKEKEITIEENGKKMACRIADVTGITCDEAGYRKLSKALCEAVKIKEYQVLWKPQLKVIMK